MLLPRTLKRAQTKNSQREGPNIKWSRNKNSRNPENTKDPRAKGSTWKSQKWGPVKLINKWSLLPACLPRFIEEQALEPELVELQEQGPGSVVGGGPSYTIVPDAAGSVVVLVVLAEPPVVVVNSLARL